MYSSEITKIHDILKNTPDIKYSGERHSGEFGIEIETETEKAYDYPSLKFWNTVKDNSLRDWGVEYVLKAPMDLPELEKAFSEFDLCEKKYKFKKSSVSTSVHVHVNFLNDTYLTLANFFTAYALMENLLIRYSGPDRLSNLFCLPMIDCEGVPKNIENILSYIGRNLFKKTTLPVDRVKYGAINPAPLTKLGTIEIRSFRGETDTKIIHDWISIIKKLKDFAKREDMTPVEILNLWKDNKHLLVNIIFQEYAPLIKMKDNAETNSLIQQNLKFALDFANVTKTWNKFGVLKIKPVFKEKIKDRLDEISNSKFSMSFDALQYHERLTVFELYERSNPTTKVIGVEEDV